METFQGQINGDSDIGEISALKLGHCLGISIVVVWQANCVI